MMSKSNFKDHFSSVSKDYARFRPDYPEELFKYLTGLCMEHEIVWDCGTGTGQAAESLAQYFKKVIATDASENQIEHTNDHPQIEYRVMPARNTNLEDNSVDLVTVAQALHWFDHPGFFKEVERVGKPGSILAVWNYQLTNVNPEVDKLIRYYYRDIVGPYWPTERELIESNYQTIYFPFQPLDSPDFEMEKIWTLDMLLAYLNTWSATDRYKKDKNENPIDIIAHPLEQIFTQPERVTWPLNLRVFRIKPA